MTPRSFDFHVLNSGCVRSFSTVTGEPGSLLKKSILNCSRRCEEAEFCGKRITFPASLPRRTATFSTNCFLSAPSTQHLHDVKAVPIRVKVCSLCPERGVKLVSALSFVVEHLKHSISN